MHDPDKLIFVGFISSCFGIRGEVIIRSLTSPSTNICNLPLFNEDNQPFTLKLIKQNSKGDLICRINDIRDRTTAEQLVKTGLFCRRSSLPSPIDEEYYIEDLKGIKVIDARGEKIGTIINISNFGAGDILEIEFNCGKIEMFPFEKKYFPEISLNYALFTPEEK